MRVRVGCGCWRRENRVVEIEEVGWVVVSRAGVVVDFVGSLIFFSHSDEGGRGIKGRGEDVVCHHVGVFSGEGVGILAHDYCFKSFGRTQKFVQSFFKIRDVCVVRLFRSWFRL